MESALTMAAQIANKSPVAVQGTKDNLNFSRFGFSDGDGNSEGVLNLSSTTCRNVHAYIFHAAYLKTLEALSLFHFTGSTLYRRAWTGWRCTT